MANLNYSKTFTPTQTTLTLAGYRYSTDNYRDLNDVLEQRYATNNNQTGTYSDAYRQRSRFDLTMNQILGSYGTIFLSGSISNYHYRSDKNIQAQLGYSKSFKNGVNLNLAVVKQYYDKDNNNSLSDKYNYFNYTPQRKSETSFSLSVNIPLNLGRKKGGNNFSLSYLNNAEHTNSYQAAFSGYQGKVNPLNYSLGASYDDQSKNTMFNGSLGKRFTYANTGLNASVSDNYWQVGGNLQGALAIHSGGITLGQYLSETFALVEAKGAQGAEVNNSQGTKIDRFGYALIPSLTPYQANTVSINPVGTSYFLDIEASKDQVVPYAGAAVKVKFKTQMGYPLLIQVKRESGEYIPLGSTILNEQGKVLGIAGQNGQMYIRTEKEQGRLTITWGDTDHEKCHIGYAIPANVEEQPFISLSGVCIEDNK